MAGLSHDAVAGIQKQLQQAVVNCNERCLYHSAKWSAELLNSLPESTHDAFNDSDTDIEDSFDAANTTTAGKDSSPFGPKEARLQRSELSKFLMAKSFFDCREYDRCAATLLPSLLPQQPINRELPVTQDVFSPSKGKARATLSPRVKKPPTRKRPSLSQKSLFLALYAKYMAGEKRKEEDSEMILGPADGPVTMNKELVNISSILEEYLNDEGGITSNPVEHPSDGFLEYLYGIVLLKGKNETLAKQWLLKSVTLYEWNWGAWQELASLIGSVAELTEVCQHLSPNMPAFLFQIYCSQELYQGNELVHNRITEISTVFPGSAFLQTQRALLYYHSKEFEEAARIFSNILSTHPYRLDSLDAYSNMLYVMEGQRPKLSYLASVASATDKFRPETCCIIANYYSKASEHEKAVMYFRRALTLDRSFLSAWTLMGHEYIELKNTQAAIEAYRRAVDANKKDYRAWHGLGLGYELLDMHSYALYYYQRAAALQPWDPKMWMAVGSAFEKCGKVQSAIRTYKRALAASSYGDSPLGSSFGSGANADPLAGAVGGEKDADILYQLALLYEVAEEPEEAAAYMELCLAQEEGPDEEDLPPGASLSTIPAGIGVTQTTSKARLWLARWCFARQEWQRATELANELCQDSVEVEEAKALIRDVRARLGSEGGDMRQDHAA